MAEPPASFLPKVVLGGPAYLDEVAVASSTCEILRLRHCLNAQAHEPKGGGRTHGEGWVSTAPQALRAGFW